MRTLVAKGKSGNWYEIIKVKQNYHLNKINSFAQNFRPHKTTNYLDLKDDPKEQFVVQVLQAIGNSLDLGDFLGDFGDIPIGRILEAFKVIEI